MGLGNSEDASVDDGGGGGGGKATSSSVSCSICLEVVADNGERSLAKLLCGHQFHLDCIGSAFNVKGAMQCPNCRKIEKGQWLYANGSRSSPEFNMEDWSHDEDLYDFGYSGMSFGVHWCPFGQLARLPSSFERLPLSYEEGEFPLAPYHDMLGQHAILSEHAAVSSATHPCPYIAYVGPIHPSSSNSSGNVSDSSSFSTHWSGPPSATEMRSSYTFPTMDIHYHSWEHHFPPFSTSNGRVGPVDQPSVPPVLQRSARATLDMPRTGSFMHPFVAGHSSGSRAGSSVTPSMVPPYPGSNARAHDRVQALQAYYQQQPPSNSPLIRTPITSGNRRTSGHRGPAPAGPLASSPTQTGSFYVFPPSTFDRNFQEPENPVPPHFHSWARDLHPMSLNQVDRDSSWGTFFHPANLPDSGLSSGSFRQRHGSDRTS